MLVKMEFLGITGPVDKIDEITEKYLANRDFHLENSLTELKEIPDLYAFNDENPYKELLSQSQGLLSAFSHEDITRNYSNDLSLSEIKDIITNLSKASADMNDKKSDLNIKLADVENEMANLAPFRKVDANLKNLMSFSHLIMRMGRLPYEQYVNFVSYAEEDMDLIFIKTYEDDEYVYGIYFSPKSSVEEIDNSMKRFNFSPIRLKRVYDVAPNIAYEQLVSEKKDLENQISIIDSKLSETLQNHKLDLLKAHHSLIKLSNNFDIRNYAAITISGHKKFFIICGWMPYKEAEEVKRLMNDDPNVYYDTDVGSVISHITPPTLIKNPKFFKPFESFIRMYGVPRYNEFDPTIFLAITYTLIFGIMFGDVGQGALLIIGGAILYKIKKIDLAAIISCAGIFSVIFGFMYGSIFGFENIIKPVWANPMHNIQTVLIVSITFGIGLILFSMMLNIINSIRSKEWDRLLFSPNGIAGLTFYITVLASIYFAIVGKSIFAKWLLIILIGIPLLLLAFKTPLSNLIQGKKKLIDESPGNFFIEAFFELFEIVLNYITNTISFVRIGAFALSHAGMMFVVMELSHANQGHPNIIIVILGNVLVMGLEGLIVGIQVLRLEYYELFSRFYMGDGREFKSYLK